MIVYDLNLVRALLGPKKTDAILIIDPDAVLALPVTSQCFKPITRWDPEFLQD
jgi:hypothetical protein